MKRKKPKRWDRERGRRRRTRDRIRQQNICSIVSLLLFCGRALAQFLSPSDLLRADRVYPHVITCFVNLLCYICYSSSVRFFLLLFNLWIGCFLLAVLFLLILSSFYGLSFNSIARTLSLSRSLSFHSISLCT